LNANASVRQFHRWVSMAFTAGVIANFAVMGQEKYPIWAGVMAGLPLALLQFTGLYLLVQPWLAKRRAGRGAA
jgi:hypothetical protein